jgi:hypothetical protein
MMRIGESADVDMMENLHNALERIYEAHDE